MKVGSYEFDDGIFFLIRGCGSQCKKPEEFAKVMDRLMEAFYENGLECVFHRKSQNFPDEGSFNILVTDGADYILYESEKTKREELVVLEPVAKHPVDRVERAIEEGMRKIREELKERPLWGMGNSFFWGATEKISEEYGVMYGIPREMIHLLLAKIIYDRF